MSDYDRLHEEYESLVEEARKRTEVASKDYIPKCCENLKKQGLPSEKITHRIREDFSFWSTKTIYEAIPDEYKKETKPKNVIVEKINGGKSILTKESSRDNSNEPVTDKPNNDQYGMGVVPMSNESPPEPKSQGVRIVMSGGKFAGLITAMKDIQDANGMKPRYVIEYDPKERDLYVDLAEEGEAKNVND